MWIETEKETGAENEQGSKTLTNMVYEQVYADVVNAKLDCNDLITEAKLAEQLQVSKAPAPDAFADPGPDGKRSEKGKET